MAEKWPPWPEYEGREDAGKVNVYTCELGHRTKTVNMDSGTTPFMIGCKTKGCTEMAQSCFYRCPQSSNDAEWCWRHPDRVEYEAASEEMKEHFRQGGLQLFRRSLASMPHRYW